VTPVDRRTVWHGFWTKPMPSHMPDKYGKTVIQATLIALYHYISVTSTVSAVTSA